MKYVGGFSSASVRAGDPHQFFIALQCCTSNSLCVRSAALELQSEDGAVSSVELMRASGGPLGELQPRVWAVLTAAVPPPSSGRTGHCPGAPIAPASWSSARFECLYTVGTLLIPLQAISFSY